VGFENDGIEIKVETIAESTLIYEHALPRNERMFGGVHLYQILNKKPSKLIKLINSEVLKAGATKTLVTVDD
jgi:hypothetical protein